MGRLITSAGALLMLALFAACALADGKFYWREPVPPDLPYQRALIVFDEGDQALILQSAYDLKSSGTAPSIGWVVPLPEVPQLASMEHYHAEVAFYDLERASRPVAIRISEALIMMDFLAFVVFLVLWIVAILKKEPGRRILFFKLMVICFFIFLLYLLFVPSLGRGGFQSLEGVEVIRAERIGVYDAQIVKSDDSAALVAWLDENEFKFGDNDRKVFDNYIDRGWIFVVAKLAPDVKESEAVHAFGKDREMTAPLIMRFNHPQPIYPLALTGTGGYDTTVLLYILSRNRMECGDRIRLRFAGETGKYFREDFYLKTEPDGILDGLDIENLGYLTKFRESLKPERMDEDIVFDRAPDDKPFKDWVVIW